MIEQVLILEDQAVMREFLVKAAESAFAQAAIDPVATLAQASKALDQQHYSLALVDISLPDGNGIDLVTRIRQQQPECRIVMCTIFDDDEHLFDALRAGAQGYLLKEHPLQELIEQLRQILSDRPPLSPLIANRILEHFHQVSEPPPTAQETEDYQLTQREREVLTLIAKGLTRKEVAEALVIGPYTVADYIKTIYRKLKVSSRAEATVEALRMGLIKI